MDPFATFGGGLSAGGGGPSGANGTNSSGFNSSGWAVSFGAGNANATASGAAGPWWPYLIAGAAVLVLWRMKKRR